MIDVSNCIMRYFNIIHTEDFVLHSKKLAHRMITGIRKGYKENINEPNIVRLIENIINSVGRFETKNRFFSIITKSIFIHGHRSNVDFEYYGRRTRRELGDIIFILSVVYNNRKYFEKMTITQFKKSDIASWNLYNRSAREQLYLLSRFPKFNGADRSLIPNKSYNLPNYSRCLGTHGLLYSPGDFSIISSNLLETILHNRKRIYLENLLQYCSTNYFYIAKPIFIPDLLDIPILFEFYKCFPFIWDFPLLGVSCVAYNCYDFSDKYLIGLIGEMIYAKKMFYNRLAFQFLQDFLMSVKAKAIKKNQKEIREFVDSFYQFEYSNPPKYEGSGESDYEGGGIGIIHTIIKLSE